MGIINVIGLLVAMVSAVSCFHLQSLAPPPPFLAPPTFALPVPDPALTFPAPPPFVLPPDPGFGFSGPFDDPLGGFDTMTMIMTLPPPIYEPIPPPIIRPGPTSFALGLAGGLATSVLLGGGGGGGSSGGGLSLGARPTRPTRG